MMKKILLPFCLIFILSIPTTSFAWGLEIAGGAWYQKPSGNMSFDQSTHEDDLDLEFEGRGIGWSSNYYVSLIGRLKVKPYGPLFVAGGYRYDNVKIDYSDLDLDVKFQGPFAEAGLEF
jgi:hypothetical protein